MVAGSWHAPVVALLPRRLVDPFTASSRRFVRRWALASLAANIVIVLTGAAVRLTSSGLGCPTWPRCTDASFVPHRELGGHGVIEFGNRMLTYVVAAVAIATWIAVWNHRPQRRSLRMLATVLALGVPAQAVLGGITVLTGLNPWTVGAHLVVSMALVALSVVLIRRVDEGDSFPRPLVSAPVGQLVRLTYALLWIVIVVGTVVTGSGPHAGDVDSPRNGFDPRSVTQLHTDVVFLLLGLTIGVLLTLRSSGASERIVSVAGWLLAAELAQGLIGFVQYFTDLPVVLVEFHLVGACVLMALGTWLVVLVRDPGRPPTPDLSVDTPGRSAPID